MALDPAILEEVLNITCGSELGRGVYRKVFELPNSPQYVMKIEEGPHSFSNVMEWEVWAQVKETKWAKWFAPCRSISPNGRVLIMDRTAWATRESYPEQIPVFLTDTKYTNYGLFDGRIVCHDYGSSLLPTYGLSNRMKKAEWWE